MNKTWSITTTYIANGKCYPEKIDIIPKLEDELDKHVESSVVNIYPNYEYQEIEGFGGAMTESSAFLLSKMDKENRHKALCYYFGKDGLNIRYVRTHIDSCDFSLDQYQAVADPISDPNLETFTIERDKKYIIPMLKEALEISENPVSVLLSPWSPPAAWKTPPILTTNDIEVYGMMGKTPPKSNESSRTNGGKLKPEFYASWAKYLVKYIKCYLNENIPVTMLSIQNESIASTPWDSCVWTVEEEKNFLCNYLYPEMERAKLTEIIGIYFWDHNKERLIERSQAMLDENVLEKIQGIAFHWYSGDHFEALQMFRESYPDKVLMHSESCVLHAPGKDGMTLPFMPQSPKTVGAVEHEDAIAYAHDLIGNINAGMNRWIDWNFVVDEKGGPRHVPGGFAAPLIADDHGGFRATPSYHYIAHFARFIKPGSHRIGFSRFTDTIEITSVKNPDGAISTIFLNKTNEDK